MLISKASRIREKPTKYELAELQSAEIRTDINTLDFRNAITKESKSTHTSEAAVHSDEVENSLGRRIATDFIDDSWDIFARGHADDIVGSHPKELLDFSEHPRQVSHIELDKFSSVGFDIGGDEFVFGKHNFLTVWALKVESGRDYRISNRLVSQGAGTAGIGRFHNSTLRLILTYSRHRIFPIAIIPNPLFSLYSRTSTFPFRNAKEVGSYFVM